MADKKAEQPECVHPPDAFYFILRKLACKLPQEDKHEMIRCIDGLAAYFRESPDSKVRSAESRISSIKYALELKERECKELALRNESQAKLLKESGIKKEMNDLYQKLNEISFITRG